MADERDPADNPELIEHQMQSTRESLTEKVAALESQVTGTISAATSTVQETIETVKEAMKETVGSVKETVTDVRETVAGTVHDATESVKGLFDLAGHTRKSPVGMVGGATAVGFVAGYLLFRGRGGLYAEGPGGSHPSMPAAAHPSHSAGESYSAPRAAYAAPAAAAAPSGPSWLGKMFAPLLDKAMEEVQRIGGQALAQATSQLEQSLSTQVPKLIDGAVASAAGVFHQEPTAAGGDTHRGPNGAGRSAAF